MAYEDEIDELHRLNARCEHKLARKHSSAPPPFRQKELQESLAEWLRGSLALRQGEASGKQSQLLQENQQLHRENQNLQSQLVRNCGLMMKIE